MLDDPAEGSFCRRLAAGDGFELLDRIPLDLNRDPLLGMMLSNDLSDALCNRSVGLGPPHAPDIKALQPLYRPFDPLVAIARIALLLLARSVPVEHVYRLLRELADQGAGILFYSTDYDELIGCCDRVVVMYDGHIIRELAGEAITEQAIVASALAIGVSDSTAVETSDESL